MITQIICLVIGGLVERVVPAKPQSLRDTFFNWLTLIPLSILRAVAVMLVMIGTVAVTNRLGGGLITLPSHGYLFVPAIAAYTLVMDLGEYLFHRAQHHIPAMWAMHSFHHSDPAFNVTTTARHFWAEQAIKACSIYFVAGLLFEANPEIIAVYSTLSLLNYVNHMNVRLGYGRAWFLLNSPHYHRVHHSSLEAHYDKNFAGLFPIYDVIFGTAYRPHTDEYPPTGLYDHSCPRTLLEAVMWPFVGLNFFARAIKP